MILETNLKGVLAIVEYLRDKGATWREIDNGVFYGFADEYMLRSALRELRNEKLVDIRVDVYTLSDRGRVFWERNKP